MRDLVTRERIQQLMRRLGRRTRGPGRVYFTGGASALLIGWRPTTIDVDLRLDPEPAGAFEAIRDLKRDLRLNIELASPQDFLPELPGWRHRSLYIDREGQVDFFHYDFYAQALSKLERGHDKDMSDVEAMVTNELVDPYELLELFERIKDDLIRFPSVEPTLLGKKVKALVQNTP